MSILKIFKALRAFRKMIRELPQQIEAQAEAYRAMTKEELAALPDEELFSAARSRIDAIADQHEQTADALAALNPSQQTVYTVDLWTMEINNGGLCQFFVNSSRDAAPLVSKSLQAIGADAHRTLYDRFVQDNHIDLHDLSSFIIRRSRDFEKQADRYPFDSFDDAFYELPDLEEPLCAYIRRHITDF